MQFVHLCGNLSLHWVEIGEFELPNDAKHIEQQNSEQNILMKICCYIHFGIYLLNAFKRRI